MITYESPVTHWYLDGSILPWPVMASMSPAGRLHRDIPDYSELHKGHSWKTFSPTDRLRFYECRCGAKVTVRI